MLRRLALLLAALALPSVAQAQNGGFIQYTPPQLAAVSAGVFSIPATQAGRGPAVLGMGIAADPVVMFGYNQKPDFTLATAGEPGAAWGVEGYYDDLSGQIKMESYFQYMWEDGSGKYNRPFFSVWNRTTRLPVWTVLSGGTSGVSIFNNVGAGALGEQAFVLGTAVANFGSTVNTAYVPWIVPDGLQSAPSLEFSSSPSTGLYYNGGNVYVSIAGTGKYRFGATAFYPVTADSVDTGAATIPFKDSYLARSIQGSKSKALTAAAATEFVRVAIPQTALVNFAGGKVYYQVYETDGTDMTTLKGEAQFNCVNKAGTEGCSAIADVQTAIYTSQGADTLTCAITAVTGLADMIGLAANCTDAGSMAETSFTIYYRLDMLQPNTVTPQ
jgi:hypothetical protein